MTLMFGMGLQNIPEGVAVSVPLLREGFSKNRAFFFGQLSGIVEPIAAVFGALVVGIAEPILPFALAFAAGAMIFVVVEEVIPESHASGHGDAASLGVIIGFVVMMCLEWRWLRWLIREGKGPFLKKGSPSLLFPLQRLLTGGEAARREFVPSSVHHW